jgi:hypothetical protein
MYNHNSERVASNRLLALYQASQAGIIYETLEFHLKENTQPMFYEVNISNVFRTIIGIYSTNLLKLTNIFITPCGIYYYRCPLEG